MNTNNVYYSMLLVTTSTEDYPNDYVRVKGEGIKPVLVLVKPISNGELIAKDLNSKRKYMTEIPLEVGKLFVHPAYLLPFNYFDNVPNKLSKRKIIKIGNENLKEAEKTLKLKSNNK